MTALILVTMAMLVIAWEVAELLRLGLPLSGKVWAFCKFAQAAYWLCCLSAWAAEAAHRRCDRLAAVTTALEQRGQHRQAAALRVLWKSSYDAWEQYMRSYDRALEIHGRCVRRIQH